jgi:predicted ribosomally synthesized peptide with nif11-like leader
LCWRDRADEIVLTKKENTMIHAELTRLLEDLRQDPDLLNESRTLLQNPDSALLWANGKGYQVTPDDIAVLLDSDRELADDDLDQAAGGDAAWPPV